jgi:hypothetical protein
MIEKMLPRNAGIDSFNDRLWGRILAHGNGSRDFR